MKQRAFILLIAAISVAALSFIGYTILLPKPTNTEDTLPSVADAEGIYTRAASRYDPTQDSTLRISLTTEMTVDGSVFLEISEQTVQYDVQSPDRTTIQLQETINSGTHSISVLETHSDDTIYLTVNDIPFVSACDAESYNKTLIPAIVLTPGLYSNINGFDNGSSYTINFSQPANLEGWLTDDTATLIDARGVATVDYNGHLESSMYTAAYLQDGIHIRTTAHVSIEETDVTIALPEDTSQYTSLSYWEGPKILERVCGFLIQADRISANYNDSIYFQAIGDRRIQNIVLNACNDGNWSMSMTTNVSLKNDAKQDQESTYTKTELFYGDQYLVSSDGNAPSVNTGINVDTVYNYFQNQLVSTIILPQDISNAEITEEANTLQIDFTGTETFGNFLAENACQVLYGNPTLIADTGAKIATNKLHCYLKIDKFTRLPIASGIVYTGSYKAEGLPYKMEYSAEQSYFVPSDTAKDEIEKAAGK